MSDTYTRASDGAVSLAIDVETHLKLCARCRFATTDNAAWLQHLALCPVIAELRGAKEITPPADIAGHIVAAHAQGLADIPLIAVGHDPTYRAALVEQAMSRLVDEVARAITEARTWRANDDR